MNKATFEKIVGNQYLINRQVMVDFINILILIHIMLRTL